MPYYVPLGPRGFLLRVGTFLIGLLGTWIYWRAARRRSSLGLSPVPVLVTDS